jgi:hypothetical protein
MPFTQGPSQVAFPQSRLPANFQKAHFATAATARSTLISEIA